MSTIRVSIPLVDGGLIEYDEGPEFMDKLHSLQSQGFIGKQLVQRLITDDWAAPPLSVEICGKEVDGTSFEIRIPYV